MIQIHDSKKKGEYFVRTTAKNGEPLATSETLKSTAAVNKNICAMFKIWVGWGKLSIEPVMDELHDDLRDHTTEGYWAKKYGCKKGKKP